MGAAGPEGRSRVVEACRQQGHQTLAGWGRIPLVGRSKQLLIRFDVLLSIFTEIGMEISIIKTC